MAASPGDKALEHALATLGATRPTAVNLRWALEEMRGVLAPLPPGHRADAALAKVRQICVDDIAACEAIGTHGAGLISEIAEKKRGKPVNILTHCNTGWIACVDWGTALAAIYKSHDAGIPIHVWVDETRPRLQGALTAWELQAQGIPHHLITDNAGGLLMQQGDVDIAIVGADRVTANGDVANKIGTYLKALAAKEHGVPFYVALPGSTIDWSMARGSDIPIEERSESEILSVRGRTKMGGLAEVEIAAPGSPAHNPGFDITPAKLVTGLITERGIAGASAAGLRSLYPQR
jgi:methylthioribose-1-phosphate isomerase